jgi:rubrerythrin
MEKYKIESLIENTENIVELLESAKHLMKDDYVKFIDYYNGCHITKNSYTLDTLISDLKKGIAVYKLQMSCKHESKTGLIFIGNDSHYKYYHNTCKVCGYIVETEQI